MILLIITSTLSYSQAIQIESGDTLVVVPIDNIKRANNIFIEWEHMKRSLEIDSLIIYELQDQVQEYKLSLDLSDRQINDLLSSADHLNSINQDCSNKLDKAKSDIKRERIKKKIFIALVIVALLL